VQRTLCATLVTVPLKKRSKFFFIMTSGDEHLSSFPCWLNDIKKEQYGFINGSFFTGTNTNTLLKKRDKKLGNTNS
jgi:hypothetical protein